LRAAPLLAAAAAPPLAVSAAGAPPFSSDIEKLK